MRISSITKKLALSAIAVIATMSLLGGHAAARVQYNANGTSTTTTPIFNQFYDVPNGVGDEADFVRLKTKAGTNADYVDTLNAACNVGDVFTVRTYIHNGADPSLNQNGAGTAVAHNVVAAMNAQLNSERRDFTFTSKITANNAAAVTDTGKLACGNSVILKLVPRTVQTYSKALGFITEDDSAVNGTLKVGSQVHGSGDQWACWDDRITIQYDVQIEKAPTPPPAKVPATCDLLAATISGRTVTVSDFKYTLNDATLTNVSVEMGDGKTVTLTKAQLPFTYTYAKDGEYTVRATIKTSLGDVTSNACAVKVKATTPTTPKPPTPPVTPPVTPKPPKLADTGAGSILGVFASVTVAGAIAHRLVWARRFNRG